MEKGSLYLWYGVLLAPLPQQQSTFRLTRCFRWRGCPFLTSFPFKSHRTSKLFPFHENCPLNSTRNFFFFFEFFHTQFPTFHTRQILSSFSSIKWFFLFNHRHTDTENSHCSEKSVNFAKKKRKVEKSYLDWMEKIVFSVFVVFFSNVMVSFFLVTYIKFKNVSRIPNYKLTHIAGSKNRRCKFL